VKKIIPLPPTSMTFTESLRATTFLAIPAIVAVTIVALVGLFLIGSGCSPAETKQGIKSALDIADAVCESTVDQNDPEWERIACKYIDKADSAAKIFLVRVPKKTFALSRPCSSANATPSASTSK